MPAAKSKYVCAGCGWETAGWVGRCRSCGEWDTVHEEAVTSTRSSHGSVRRPVAPTLLSEVETTVFERLECGIGEFDRALGGGMVPGSMVLIGGSPGIGKSTLLNQMLGGCASRGVRTLYVSAEESACQVKLRAERLGAAALDVPVVSETSLEVVLATMDAERPQVCVVDSVQALDGENLQGAPGSVGQVREAAAALLRLAKEKNIATVLVGHVTKEGALAGPRVLEHLVDAVLQFEGERDRPFRVLRALKNRFGSTSELGVFEMVDHGLREVKDPSAFLLGDRAPRPGSCILCAMEGSRAMLVEVQALIVPTSAVPPRRVAEGVDRNRLSLVLAVLSRHGGLRIGDSDVFVSAAGGVEITEPGADLAVALAIASAGRAEVPGDSGRLAAFGEVGLGGELRYVHHPDLRVREARRFGIGTVISPEEHGTGHGIPDGVSICSTLAEAVAVAFDARPTRAGLPRAGRTVAA